MTHHSQEAEVTMLYTFARTLAKGNSAVEHNRVVEKFDLYYYNIIVLSDDTRWGTS